MQQNYSQVQQTVDANYVDPNELLQHLKPSQIINFPWLILAGLSFLINPGVGGIALMLACLRCLHTNSISYKIYPYRILFKHGFFGTQTTVVQNYKIKSIQLEQPVHYQVVGLSNLHIHSSDRFAQDITMYAVDLDGEELQQRLIDLVEAVRAERGIQEVDVYNINQNFNHKH